MKQDTVMQTGDKTKYKHVFVCGVARSETSLLGRNIARLENCTGFKNTGQAVTKDNSCRTFIQSRWRQYQ